MDFPLVLENRVLVSGKEELQQIMTICLKQEYGTILHNVRMGTRLSVHSYDPIIVDKAIRDTLNAIQGVEVTSIEIRGEVADILYKYNGDTNQFKYNLT